MHSTAIGLVVRHDDKPYLHINICRAGEKRKYCPLSPFIITQTIIIFLLFILLGLTLREKGHIKEYRRFSKVMRSLSFLPLFFIKTAILLDVEFPLSLTFALEVCQFSPKDVWLLPSCRNKQDAIL